jgi:hypothetical protein
MLTSSLTSLWAALERLDPNTFVITGSQLDQRRLRIGFVMGKIKLILALAVVVLAGVAGWRIAACALAGFELRQDMRDLAAQVPSRIGLTPQNTDEDFRIAVVRSAQDHEIQLEPAQVTVRRTGTREAPIIYLAADYNVPVELLGFSFTLHFTPSSAK